MSKNFFAALDDSDNETDTHKVVVKKTTSTKAKKAPVAEPSKTQDRRREAHHDKDRNTSKGKRTANRDGKRAYDRRSGTGRGKEIKKGGGGARNWGSDKEEIARRTETEAQEEHKESDEAPKVVKEEVVEEEVDNTVSYEEYMRQKSKPDNALFASIQTRQVENEFATVNPKVAEETDFFVKGGMKEKRKKESKKEKKTLDLNIRVKSSNTSGRDEDRRKEGRGGRGRGSGGGRGGSDRRERRGPRGEGGGGGRGGRGGRGEGRGRGSGGRGSGGRGSGRGGGGKREGGINLTDSSAFPSL